MRRALWAIIVFLAAFNVTAATSPDPRVPTNTILNCWPPWTAVAGQPVTMRAVVTSATPPVTGQVEFIECRIVGGGGVTYHVEEWVIGTATLDTNGAATVVGAFRPGTPWFVARYRGDQAHAPSSSGEYPYWIALAAAAPLGAVPKRDVGL